MYSIQQDALGILAVFMAQADALKEEDNRGCCSIHDNDVALERNIGLIAGEAAMKNINPFHTDFLKVLSYTFILLIISLQ